MNLTDEEKYPMRASETTDVEDGWVVCKFCRVKIHNGHGLRTFIHGKDCPRRGPNDGRDAIFLRRS